MDVSIKNVLEVLDREIKHDGRISGLGKHAGKHVKVVAIDDCEDGLFIPALKGPDEIVDANGKEIWKPIYQGDE